MKQNNYRHAFIFQVTSTTEILLGLKDDLQKVVKKQKIKEIYLF